MYRPLQVEVGQRKVLAGIDIAQKPLFHPETSSAIAAS
jgi:hypothetical protein